jgi:hypothetical protein
VLDRLQQDVLQHVGHALDDDAAMLLLRREPALMPPAPGVNQLGTAGSRGLLAPSGVRDLSAAELSRKRVALGAAGRSTWAARHPPCGGRQPP